MKRFLVLSKTVFSNWIHKQPFSIHFQKDSERTTEKSTTSMRLRGIPLKSFAPTRIAKVSSTLTKTSLFSTVLTAKQPTAPNAFSNGTRASVGTTK